MTTRKQRKDKPALHNIEQDKIEGMVKTGPDFGTKVDENLYKMRENTERSISEERRESKETL